MRKTITPEQKLFLIYNFRTKKSKNFRLDQTKESIEFNWNSKKAILIQKGDIYVW